MDRPIRAYLVALLVVVLLDALWLGFIAIDFYKAGLGTLMADRPNWFAAGTFYLLYPVGLAVFVVVPAKGRWGRAALRGALFGFIAYMTYDLTNLATLNGFPLGVALVDMAWGTAVGAVAAGVAARLSFYP